MKDEYYKPSDIKKYNKYQVRWLLKYVLFQDSWPSDHKETGFTGGNGKQNSHIANFTITRDIIGELNARMKLCGTAGLFLEYLNVIDYEDKPYLIRRLAVYHNLPDEEVSYQANLALRFCCGHKRKRVTFNTFCIYTKARDRARHKKRWPERLNPDQ